MIKCGSKNINLRLDYSEKNSMLVIGNSRSGKTFFASNFAAGLISKGYRIHLIDLGDKWSKKDKERLRLAGAQTVKVEQQGIELVFQTSKELVDCARHIVNSLGILSIGANTAIKGILKRLAMSNNDGFQMQDVINCLNSTNQETPDEKEWAKKIYDRLDSCGDVPDIWFKVDPNGIFSDKSTIWELVGLDEVYVQLGTYLILYCLFCQQRNFFRYDIFNIPSFFERDSNYFNVFVIIDEFQNLDCNRRAIVGTCLTEGQKYKMSLILITQFVEDNFSDAVISQFKQGGYRFFFRLTEEEAWDVSKQLAYEVSKRKELCQKLTHLPVGNCLMLGAHSLENRTDVSENFRFVQIEEEPITSYSRGGRGTVYMS